MLKAMKDFVIFAYSLFNYVYFWRPKNVYIGHLKRTKSAAAFNLSRKGLQIIS